jgi:YHS domain-containing protein
LPVTAEEIPWLHSLPQAMAMAQKENKPILIHFSADFCGACRVMEKNIFPDPRVAGKVTQNFVPVMIDTTKEPEITQKYNVKKIPMDVFAVPTGEAVGQQVGGGSSVNQYLAVLERALELTRAGIIPSQMPIHEPTVVMAPPQSPFPQNTAQMTHEFPPQKTQPRSVEWTEAVSDSVQNFNARNFPQYPVYPSQNVQNITQNPQTVSLNPQHSPSLQLVASVTPSAGMGETAELGGGTPLEAVMTAPHQQSVVSSPRVTPASAVFSAEEKPIIFDGYCPVTLSEESRWCKGTREFAAEYENGVFLFVSEQARQEFLKNPPKFAPIASGNDIVEWTMHQKKTLGSRKFGAWFQGNVYLFVSKENYDKFQSNPHFFAGQALQWSRLFAGNGR